MGQFGESVSQGLEPVRLGRCHKIIDRACPEQKSSADSWVGHAAEILKEERKGCSGENNFTGLPVTSFCVPLPLIEHPLCDGHCAYGSRPRTGSFHTQLRGKLKSTHNATTGVFLSHSCIQF